MIITMNFSDLLKKPLPSATQAGTSYTESMDDCDSGFCGEDFSDLQGTNTTDENPVALENDEAPDNHLTPEQEQEVDDAIVAVATPILLQAELSEDEIHEFVEGLDSDVAIAEGVLTEKTIVRFDKKARLSQLYEVAVYAIARAKNDRLYKKLDKVYAMERLLKAKLRKKYNAQAQKKAKEYLAKMKQSKSGIIAKIASKISGK